MKPEYSFVLKGTLFCVAGILFMMWGVSDLVIVFDAPRILIFIIPAITAVIAIILEIVVIVVIYIKNKNSIFNEKTIYYCTECESTIKLEEKLCSNCGAENIKRKEALEQIEDLEKSIENNKLKILEKSQSKKWRSPRNKKLDERYIQLLNNQARKVKIRKMELIIGSTLEAKIKWVKTQYHDMNRSIRDVAEELGENRFTVRRWIDPDSQNDKRENLTPLQEKRDSYTRRIENSDRIEKKPEILYLMRISKEINENGKEVINKICANCGEKNNFTKTDGNIFQCLKCGANHHIRED